ncbi:MAG: hypothetical protein RLZZ115_1930, partial [Cyanobacteriota bacterium]
LTSVPESITRLTNLSQLDLGRNQLTSVPESITRLTNLSQLDLGRNQLTSVPESIGSLTNLSQLNLSENQLTNVPESIGSLTNLSQLDLGRNQLTSVPESITRLTNLSKLYLSYNQLTSVPESIGSLTNLSYLYLSGNQLTIVPESIGSLTNLSQLNLRDNPLEDPPIEIAEQGINAIREYFRQKQALRVNKMVLEAPDIKAKPTITWEPLPEDFVLPDDPVENTQQPALAAALTDALGAAGYIQPEMLIASNLGLVATVNKNTVVKAPDWFYVPQVHPLPEGLIRRSYSPNIDGANVVIVMEFLSEADGGELSIRSTPPYGKFHFYEQILQVPTYVTYDPYDRSLEVRYLQDGRYVLHPANDQGRVWIPQLELYLGIWSGGRLQQTMNWLRWWDNSGNLLLWSSEEAIQERQRADQEHQRAERLAAKLRELGIDPDLPD